MKSLAFTLLLASLLMFSACVQPAPAGIAPVGQSMPTAVPTPVDTPTDAPAATSTSLPADTPAPTDTPQPTKTPIPTEVPATPTLVAESATPELQPEETTVDATLLELGKEVYARQACGVCHAFTVVGSAGIFGPSHDNLAVTATERIREERYQGNATTPEEYIQESIVDPLRFLADGYQITRFPMPIFTNLTEQEVDALIYLLMQPPTSPAP